MGSPDPISRYSDSVDLRLFTVPSFCRTELGTADLFNSRLFSLLISQRQKPRTQEGD